MTFWELPTRPHDSIESTRGPQNYLNANESIKNRQVCANTIRRAVQWGHRCTRVPFLQHGDPSGTAYISSSLGFYSEGVHVTYAKGNLKIKILMGDLSSGTLGSAFLFVDDAWVSWGGRGDFEDNEAPFFNYKFCIFASSLKTIINKCAKL